MEATVIEESVEHSWDTVPVQAWHDVDRLIAPLVIALNRIEGVRTFSSCQGHLRGEDSRAYVQIYCERWRELAKFVEPIGELEATMNGDGDSSYQYLYVARFYIDALTARIGEWEKMGDAP